MSIICADYQSFKLIFDYFKNNNLNTRTMMSVIYSFKITTFNLVCAVINWLTIITYLVMTPRVKLKVDELEQ